MTQYRIAWLPGDGIGKDVMDAARLVLDAIRLEADYVPWGHRLGLLVPGGRRPARPHRRAADERARGDVRGHHLQAGEGRGGGAGAVAPGHGSGVPLAHRPDAADVRSVHLPPSVQGLPGQSAELQGGHRPRHLPREHGRPLRGRRVQPGAGRSSPRRSPGLSKPFAPFKDLAPDAVRRSPARSTPGRARSASCARPSSTPHSTAARRSRSCTRPTWCARRTGCSSRRPRRSPPDFPGIAMDDANVDAICMWLLKNPMSYEVLVAPNLYGDIISDLAAQMVGGLGFGCSGNIGEKLAVFEPSHGSAPKYAGQYKVNPIATILAAKMMLDWLGEKAKAARLEQAVRRRDPGREGADLRHGRDEHHAGDGREAVAARGQSGERPAGGCARDRAPRGRPAGRAPDGAGRSSRPIRRRGGSET